VQARTGPTNPDPAQVKAIRRRFDALVTASSFSEVQHHLRGLITQLRSAEIALDYGRLAQDLADLQRPERVQGVRIRWARDYHRSRPDTTDARNTPTESTHEEDQ
jgi:CRISPR system Cascade subunit CasB